MASKLTANAMSAMAPTRSAVRVRRVRSFTVVLLSEPGGLLQLALEAGRVDAAALQLGPVDLDLVADHEGELLQDLDGLDDLDRAGDTRVGGLLGHPARRAGRVGGVVGQIHPDSPAVLQQHPLVRAHRLLTHPVSPSRTAARSATTATRISAGPTRTTLAP